MSNLALRLIGLVGEGEDVAAGPLEPLGYGGQLVAEPVISTCTNTTRPPSPSFMLNASAAQRTVPG